MSLWKWNDVELEIDMEDVEFQQKYENAFNKMAKTEEELQKVGAISELSLRYCNMFFQLFDDIFGEGTSQKLFNGKKNTRVVEECYDSFLEVCKNEVDQANKRRAKKYAKYMPKPGR